MVHIMVHSDTIWYLRSLHLAVLWVFHVSIGAAMGTVCPVRMPIWFLQVFGVPIGHTVVRTHFDSLDGLRLVSLQDGLHLW
jgi:hypothetical protein